MANKTIFIVEVKTWWDLEEAPLTKRDFYVFEDFKKAEDFIWNLCPGGYYSESDPYLNLEQGMPKQCFIITSVKNSQHWLVDVFEREIM